MPLILAKNVCGAAGELLEGATGCGTGKLCTFLVCKVWLILACLRGSISTKKKAKHCCSGLGAEHTLLSDASGAALAADWH